jgi:hypothetical protein
MRSAPKRRKKAPIRMARVEVSVLKSSVPCAAMAPTVSHGADAIKFVATGGVLSNIKAGLDQQFSDD